MNFKEVVIEIAEAWKQGKQAVFEHDGRKYAVSEDDVTFKGDSRLCENPDTIHNDLTRSPIAPVRSNTKITAE